MAETECVTLPAFKFVSGESENICRLCFGRSDGGVCLDESRLLKGCDNENTTVTFEDMLRDLGATTDPSLPQMICAQCANLAISAFEFKTMCQLSLNKWQQCIEKFEKTLQKTDKLNFTPAFKTAYLVVKEENIFILRSRNVHKQKDKVVLAEIKRLSKRRRHHTRYIKSLTCEDCGVTFTSKYFLEKHKKPKSDVSEMHPCPHCPSQFENERYLSDHIDRVHKPKSIQCSKCAKMFSSEKILSYHVATNHTAVKCKLCLIQFPSKIKLYQHMHKHYKSKCPRCQKEFNNKITFKKHLKMCKTDETEKPKFICDICDKVYHLKSNLVLHIRTVHHFGAAIYCNWCQKPFHTMSALNSHAVKHTRERNFHCDQCGGQFVTKRALLYHTRIHTGEKPVSCEICGERFLSTSRRMDHKRRKHFAPQKECSLCHSMFYTRFELRRHMARHNNPQSRLYTSGKREETDKPIRKRKRV